MNDKRNYFEPDILVVCDPDKLDEAGCHGAPDWVIEIVSPSSRTMDYYRKAGKYAEAGVREYWIVDPAREVVVICRMEKGEEPVICPFTDRLVSGVVEGLELDIQADVYKRQAFSRRLVFFPVRNSSTQAQDRAWEMMVARAAPWTPMSKPKIRIGSRTMLVTAPMSTESIPVFAKPWAVIKAFMPRVSWTKMVPTA